MKTLEATLQPVEAVRAFAPLRRHDHKRLSSWRVLGSTVSGFPAFLWQLTRNVES